MKYAKHGELVEEPSAKPQTNWVVFLYDKTEKIDEPKVGYNPYFCKTYLEALEYIYKGDFAHLFLKNEYQIVIRYMPTIHLC